MLLDIYMQATYFLKTKYSENVTLSSFSSGVWDSDFLLCG